MAQPVSLFLAQFIQTKERKLNAPNQESFHLINFHARIYHQILQQIDKKNYFETSSDYESEVLPRSLTMPICEFYKISKFVHADIVKFFDYNHDLHPFIDSFFELLTAQMVKKLKNAKKRKACNVNESEPKRKRVRLNPNEFGPYKRRYNLRYALLSKSFHQTPTMQTTSQRRRAPKARRVRALKIQTDLQRFNGGKLGTFGRCKADFS